MAFRNPFGGRRKRTSIAENVTTHGEYLDFLQSGLNLASGGGIADVNARTLESSALGSIRKAEKGVERQAARTSVSQRDPNAVVGRNLDTGEEITSGGIRQVDTDQVELLTGLYKQRLNDIMSRRARPGFKQVS